MAYRFDAWNDLLYMSYHIDVAYWAMVWERLPLLNRLSFDYLWLAAKSRWVSYEGTR